MKHTSPLLAIFGLLFFFVAVESNADTKDPSFSLNSLYGVSSATGYALSVCKASYKKTRTLNNPWCDTALTLYRSAYQTHLGAQYVPYINSLVDAVDPIRTGSVTDMIKPKVGVRAYIVPLISQIYTDYAFLVFVDPAYSNRATK